MSRAPRIVTVDVVLPAGETLTITPLSDLHIESSAFDERGFKQLMARRASPYHRAVLIGDVLDLVVPNDLKRFRPSVQSGQVAGRDDWINAALDCAVERLTVDGMTIDAIGPGNHEDELLKRHGIDVTSMLCREFRCARLGYSGVVRYRIRRPEQNKARVEMFSIAYHHGAWGGRLVKGFGGARDWFRMWDGWHIACFGHNHQSTIHREEHFRITNTGDFVRRPAYYVGTGTWVDSYSDDARLTHYAERAGHAPTPRTTPAIHVELYRPDKSLELRYWVEM